MLWVRLSSPRQPSERLVTHISPILVAISLAVSGPSISFTMALQAGSINVSATVCGFYELSNLVAVALRDLSFTSVVFLITLPVSQSVHIVEQNNPCSCFEVTVALFGDGV